MCIQDPITPTLHEFLCHTHTQEIGNILFGLLYFLAIPSTSMLLIIYAVANLNVVSWGTRDSSRPSGPRAQQSNLQRLQGGLRRMMSRAGGPDDNTAERDDNMSSEYTFSFGNLFRLVVTDIKVCGLVPFHTQSILFAFQSEFWASSY